MNIRVYIFLFSIIFLSTGLLAQYSPYHFWTLLSSEEMDEIIGEASGETAFNHIIEMSGYNRNRTEKEYKTTLLEGKYVLDRLKEYGIENAKIDRFPGRETWDGIKGELWEISPRKTKLADYDDLRAMLASGSTSADVTAELVWVEEGEEEDFAGIDVKNKIVVTSGSMYTAHNNAVKNGALGVISFGSGRMLIDPVQIPTSGIWSRGEKKFGFFLPPREGFILRDRLLNGEKITVHAVVESKMQNVDYQITTCVLPGSDPDADEIIFSAHVYEGYTKQGSNDNISGSAAILEIARMMNDLFNEGRLKKPKRSLRFIWVPEYSGTGPWVNANKNLMEKTLCNINMDMVGLWLSKSQSFFTMRRTTFGNPHYFNDVMESYFRFVGETNYENLSNRGGEKFPKRIVAPSGSDDPFYYKIETHYGASDHEVFNDWGVQVPGIMMITWPDFYMHSSADRPDKCDPTQLKRAIVIAAATAYTIANSDDEMTIKITDELFSNSLRRTAYQLARGIDELNKANSDNLSELYKKAKGFLGATRINEKETFNTLFELNGSDNTNNHINSMTELYLNAFEIHLKALENHMKLKATSLGVEEVSLEFTDMEKKAYSIVPKPSSKVKEEGYYGWRRVLRDLPKETTDKYPTGEISNTSELVKLIDGNHNVLQIKKMLDTQYEKESDLESILNFVKLLEVAGLVTLN